MPLFSPFFLVIFAYFFPPIIGLNCQDPNNQEYCVEVGYNRDNLPPNPPLNVTMSLSISEVSGVDDSALSISVRLAFYIYWNDSRVVRLIDGDRSINLGLQNLDKYFVPDFYIYSLLDFKQMIFSNDVKAILLTPASLIWLYMEGIVTTGCKMDFNSFPFDSHRCQVLFGSTGFPDSLMTFEAILSYSGASQRPLQYEVKIVDLEPTEKLTIYASGNYSVAGFWVELQRKTSGHVLQIIMPSAMFVVVSWISFLMPLNGGERAGLLVTLFLVLVSMFLAVVENAPKADFLTAMEVWVIGTIVFVFLALVEYGMVLKVISSSSLKAKEIEEKVEQRKAERLKKKALQIWKGRNSDVTPSHSRFASAVPSEAATTKSAFNGEEEDAEEIVEEAQKETNYIDKIALIVLPILFLIFNAVFWPYFMS